jgi:hypothetical protein
VNLPAANRASILTATGDWQQKRFNEYVRLDDYRLARMSVNFRTLATLHRGSGVAGILFAIVLVKLYFDTQR